MKLFNFSHPLTEEALRVLTAEFAFEPIEQIMVNFTLDFEQNANEQFAKFGIETLKIIPPKTQFLYIPPALNYIAVKVTATLLQNSMLPIMVVIKPEGTPRKYLPWYTHPFHGA